MASDLKNEIALAVGKEKGRILHSDYVKELNKRLELISKGTLAHKVWAAMWMDNKLRTNMKKDLSTEYYDGTVDMCNMILREFDEVFLEEEFVTQEEE